MVTIHPIGIDDAVHVKGKHLYKRDGTRFTAKGIAFPTPPVDEYLHHAHGWLDILKQLRDLDLEFNTIRLYRMYPEKVDYREFFNGAADLGVYVIVPLTSASGSGVLDRTIAAPKCYNKKLFGYGATALREYLKYPNVLAGMVGNEVMNDEEAWSASPCLRAYGRDLKLFMDRMVDEEVLNRTLPLIYAAQDSSTLGGVEMDKNEVMKLTVDYLTCAEKGKGTIVADVAGDEPLQGVQHFEENKFGQSPIDIFGVNVESWCSSTQDFRYNPDGTPGSYYSLYEALRNSSVPIIFSEMGCPHTQFDRDDLERKTKEGTRDWKQLSIVMNEMADSWSGFIAYTYDAVIDFNMFSGGPWNGIDTLTPTNDFYNFKQQLDEVSGETLHTNNTQDWQLPRRCSSVESELLSCCDLRLFNDDMMQSFQKTVDVVEVPKAQTADMQPTDTASEVVTNNHAWYTVAILPSLVLYLVIQKGRRLRMCRKSPAEDYVPLQNDFSDDNCTGTRNYGTI